MNKKMRVYFVTQKPMGDFIKLKPQLPKSAALGESNTPRICVSTSILGALSAIGPNLGFECNTYIYYCDIDADDLHQPKGFVSDIDMTGEMWILKEEVFTLHKVIRLFSGNSFKVLPNLSSDEVSPVDVYTFYFGDVKRGEYAL